MRFTEAWAWVVSEAVPSTPTHCNRDELFYERKRRREEWGLDADPERVFTEKQTRPEILRDDLSADPRRVMAHYLSPHNHREGL